MPDSTLKAIFFDLDGTLVDSIPFMQKIYLDFLRIYNYQGSIEEFNILNGKTLPEIIVYLKAKYNLASTIESLFKQYQVMLSDSYASAAPLRREALGLLSRIRSVGLRIGLVTSASQELAKSFLVENKFSHFFEHVITPDGIMKGKPNPDLYLRALEKFNITADQALVVEDSSQGAAAGRAAGIRTLQLVEGNVVDENIISNLSEVWDIVQNRQFRVFPISKNISVNVEPSQKIFEATLSSDVINEVNEIWETAKEKSPHLSNEKLFCLKTRKAERLSGEFIEYKYYFAQKKSKNLKEKLRLTPLGVSGCIYIDDSFVMAKRSAYITSYPGFYELVPSGGLNEMHVGLQGVIDFNYQLLTELREELGISQSLVQDTKPFALIFDQQDRVFDLGILISLKIDAAQILPYLKANAEYDMPFLLSTKSIESFIVQNFQKVVPTTLAMFEILNSNGVPTK